MNRWRSFHGEPYRNTAYQNQNGLDNLILFCYLKNIPKCGKSHFRREVVFRFLTKLASYNNLKWRGGSTSSGAESAAGNSDS